MSENEQWHRLFQSVWLVADSMATSLGGPWVVILMPAMKPHAERLISIAGVRAVVTGTMTQGAESSASLDRLSQAKQAAIGALKQYAGAAPEEISARGQDVLVAGGTLLTEISRLPIATSLRRDVVALADALSTLGRGQLPSQSAIAEVLQLRSALARDPGNRELRERLFELESR